MKRFIAAAIVALGLAATLDSASAHHSVSAQFDVDKTVVLKGALSKVEWINPHAYLTFLVTEANGQSYPLMLESMTPAALRRAGLSGREALKVGEIYTLYFSPSRNGNKGRGLMHGFTMPDGKTIGATTTKSRDQLKAITSN